MDFEHQSNNFATDLTLVVDMVDQPKEYLTYHSHNNKASYDTF